MRLFLGIDFPKEIKKQLYQETKELRSKYPAFHWIEPDNYHMTLHFFGDVEDPLYIAKKTKDLLFDQEQFHFYSLNLDYFMTQQISIFCTFRREKKVEWLVEKIREAFPDGRFNTREFIPHITIARCRIPSKQQYFLLKKLIERTQIDIEFAVSEIALFNSVDKEGVLQYEVLKTFPLLA